MSYDLMVFRKEAAPKSKDGFMEWFDDQTQWDEGHSYDDPANTSPELKSWFMEMIQKFPPMNGPLSNDDIDNPYTTDYSVGHDVIYASFAWSKAEEAYTLMVSLAKKHAVGFFDVSSDDGDILFPAEGGKLIGIEQLDEDLEK